MNTQQVAIAKDLTTVTPLIIIETDFRFLDAMFQFCDTPLEGGITPERVSNVPDVPNIHDTEYHHAVAPIYCTGLIFAC